jgi:hypothetical protein
MAPENCPNCGADVPRRARACPECGADEQTGWSDSAYAENLGIPDENFDYDRFVNEEFGAPPKPHGISWLWWTTALVLVLVFLFFFLR